jgi:hypothetical protein
MSEWSALNNMFLTIARESRPRAIEISAYTYNALQQRQLDVFFGPRWLIYKPLHEALKAEEIQWEGQINLQKSKTQTLDELLEELSPEKINDWEYLIRGVFAKGSVQYNLLLPEGVDVFGHGKKDDRIDLVEVLGEGLTGIPALAAVKTDVDNFHASLLAARNTQQGAISDTKTESGDVSQALEAAMIGLFSFYGACIEHFPNQQNEIKPLFHIQLIRNLPQTFFLRTVNGEVDAMEFIAKRTKKPTDRVKVKNLTAGLLRIGATEEKNDALGTGGQEVAGLEEEIYTISQLQLTPASTFFKLVNGSNIEGHCEIEFLD